MNPRFPLLSSIAVVLAWLGWLLLGLGVILLLIVCIGYFTQNHFAAMTAIIGGVLTWFGVMCVAIGESIRVFFAIEENTNASSKSLAEMCLAIRADLEGSKAKTPPVIRK
jgi:hypothetical protein